MKNEKGNYSDQETAGNFDVNETQRLVRQIEDDIQAVRRLTPTRERNLCATKLEEAAHWLQADIKRFSSEPVGTIS